jgi:hypothetical protein
MTVTPPPYGHDKENDMTLRELLDEARARIAVTDEELEEAKRRRELVRDALAAEFGGRIYFNGSLAHGDANDPLTDFDVGVVVPDPNGEYGPGGKSATDFKVRVRDAVRAALEEEFPNLRVEIEGRKRSVLIRFSDPVSDRSGDLTGDVIVALDHPEEGLWIPRFDSWDRSHPEEHTRLILEGIAATDIVLAHANRLLKHWSCRHDNPLCSWHIKALSLDAITAPMALIDALGLFFDSADASLADGDTPDPAEVGPDIKPRVSRAHARERLQAAGTAIRAAKEAEAEGRPLRAQCHLASVLPEIVDMPDAQALADEDREQELKRLRSAGRTVGVGAGAGTSIADTRGWSRD